MSRYLIYYFMFVFFYDFAMEKNMPRTSEDGGVVHEEDVAVRVYQLLQMAFVYSKKAERRNLPIINDGPLVGYAVGNYLEGYGAEQEGASEEAFDCFRRAADAVKSKLMFDRACNACIIQIRRILGLVASPTKQTRRMLSGVNSLSVRDIFHSREITLEELEKQKKEKEQKKQR